MRLNFSSISTKINFVKGSCPCFQISINGEVPPAIYINTLIIQFIYYFFRETSQMGNLIWTGNFALYDVWNLVDLFRIILLAICIFSFFHADTIYSEDPDSFLRTLIIITTFVLWVSVLNLFKNIFLNFAVFVHSLVVVLQEL